MSTASDTAVATSLLSDPKLERLLTIGKEINDLLFKISAANEYLAKGNAAEDFDAVEMARKQLARDLLKEFAEAKVLLRTVDEAIGTLAEHKREEENVLKMYVGLSRIEGLEPTEKRRSIEDRAASTRTRIVEIDNLIKAFDALQVDLGTARLRAHFCPRCSSHRISYRISPSELGYSIYKCDQCGNAWKITQFSVRAA